MARNTLKYKTIDPERRVVLRIAWNEPVAWPVVAFLVALFISGVPAYRTYRRRQRATLK
jgi:hypothetical protein